MRVLATIAAVQFLALFALNAHALPTPKGNKCPQPEHTLVLSEFQVGADAKPRWLELLNPGKAAVSLDNVVVRIKAKGIGGGDGAVDVLEFAVAQNIVALPAGEVLLVGHLPSTGNGKGPYFGLKLLDLGAKFQLPLCGVKIELIGPAGPIDDFEYDLCNGSKLPPEGLWQTVMALDPDHSDICLNDKLSSWCIPTEKASLTMPSPGKVNPSCDLDGDGYTKTTGDCDDSAKTVNPVAIEQCNGVDDDCNGKTDDDVLVAPGACLSLGICAEPKQDGQPVVACAGAAGFTCSYKEGYEAANETKCDGVDNDCDGQTDEGMLNACGKCGPPPQEVCNGLDDDCDGVTDNDIALHLHSCGTGVCATGKALCKGKDGIVCQLPAQYENEETRCDGLDNDCDGETDENLGLGNVCAVGQGACQGVGTWVCGSDDARSCNAMVGTPTEEICGDATDNDCDGETDEGFGIGEQCVAGLGQCAVIGKRVCAGGGSMKSVCSAKAGLPNKEMCGNKLDDDCDGQTDEQGCREAEDAPTTSCNATISSGGSDPWSLIGLILGVFAVFVARRSVPASQ